MEDNNLCETCINRYLNKKKPQYAQSVKYERFIPLSIKLEQWKHKMKNNSNDKILKEFEDIFKLRHIFNFDTKLTGCDIPLYVYCELGVNQKFIMDFDEIDKLIEESK